MSGGVAALLSLALAAQAPAELLAEGRPGPALLAAEALPVPLDRARWRLRVLHQAGWLDLALEEARAGLVAHPSDGYLLDQAGWLAASLGFPEASSEIAGRMVARETLDASWPTKIARQQADAERLAREARLLTSSLLRARLACGAVLALVGAGLMGARQRLPARA